MYFVYVVECGDGTLYTGITTDLARRMEQHSSGKGGAYTRTRKLKRLLYSEKHKDRSSATKRESEIKSWSRSKKLSFIAFSKA